MGFSRGQQPELRKLLVMAWAGHCTEVGIDPAHRCPVSKRCGACPYCEWYEQTLFAVTGQTSTTECNAGRDYDLFMAELEGIARAGIKWQMKVNSGDGVRLLHELAAAVGTATLEAHGVDERYLRAVAQRQQRLAEPPELTDLPRAECIEVLGEVKRWLRRAKQHETAGDAAIPEEALPF